MNIYYYNDLERFGYLDVSSGKFKIPDDAIKFNCNDRKISELPELPPRLRTLECDVNLLLVLPKLPASLVQLQCNLNKLTELPELPPILKEIYCSSNNLVEIPELPDTLKYLCCGYNNLTALPELPKPPSVLICDHNNIKYISPNNVNMINNMSVGSAIDMLHNPVSYGFYSNADLLQSFL